MDKILYDSHVKLEARHWWFKARREIVDSLLSGQFSQGKPGKTILDIGSGAGAMIQALQKYGELSLLEPNQGMAEILKTKIPANIKIFNQSIEEFDSKNKYDLISMFDVLEHIKDDLSALNKIKKNLNPGGFLVGTVPAFKFLWGIQDELSHHQQRYTKHNLIKKLQLAGLTITRATYFNTWLLPFIALVRLGSRLAKREKSDLEIFNPGFGNQILYKIFKSEKHILRKYNFPFGVSIYFSAKRE